MAFSLYGLTGKNCSNSESLHCLSRCNMVMIWHRQPDFSESPRTKNMVCSLVNTDYTPACLSGQHVIRVSLASPTLACRLHCIPGCVHKFKNSCSWNTTLWESSSVPTENSGLDLSLELFDSSGTLLPPTHHHHTVGCFVFVPSVSLKNSSNSTIMDVSYSYDFGDGCTVENSTELNITHCYNEPHMYNYSVNATALVMEERLFHTNLSNYIELFGKFY